MEGRAPQGMTFKISEKLQDDLTGSSEGIYISNH